MKAPLFNISDEEMASVGILVATDPWMVGNQACQVIVGILSIMCSAFVIRLTKKSSFHQNLKVLLVAFCLNIILFAVTTCALQSIHLYNYIVRFYPTGNGTVLLFSSSECLALRSSLLLSSGLMESLYVSVVVERIVCCVWIQRYENSMKWLAPALISISVPLCVFPVILSITSDPDHMKQLICSQMFMISLNSLRTMAFLLVLAIASIGVFFLTLLCWNHWKLRRKTYNLSESFQVHENQRIVVLFLPNVILYLAVYSIYLVCSVPQYYDLALKDQYSFQSQQDYFQFVHRKMKNLLFAYLLPWYSFLAPLGLLVVLLRNERRRGTRVSELTRAASEGDTANYFNALLTQWSTTKP